MAYLTGCIWNATVEFLAGPHSGRNRVRTTAAELASLNNRYGESLFDCAPTAAFHAMASRPWFPAAIDVSALRVSAPGDLNRAFVSVNRGSSPLSIQGSLPLPPTAGKTWRGFAPMGAISWRSRQRAVVDHGHSSGR